MTRELAVGIVQCALPGPRTENVSRVERLVREAARNGANLILPPELFEGPYFPQEESDEYFAWAHPLDRHPTLTRFAALSRELGVVIPVSFFERAGQTCFNSLAMLDVDGSILGVYRKSHIPAGPGYEEKYYFRPGNTGFQAYATPVGKVGAAICWDQWFPECARALALQGAEILLYPTAIGTEPAEPELDTRVPWRRVMVGHAVANAIPVAAANRIGIEGAMSFYGTSFICDHRGECVAEIPEGEEGVRVHRFDLDAIQRYRDAFGFFRDRRPELYASLTREGGDGSGE